MTRVHPSLEIGVLPVSLYPIIPHGCDVTVVSRLNVVVCHCTADFHPALCRVADVADVRIVTREVALLFLLFWGNAELKQINVEIQLHN